MWTFVFEVDDTDTVAAHVSEGGCLLPDFEFALDECRRFEFPWDMLSHACTVYASIQSGSCIRSIHKSVQMKDGTSKALQ